MDLQNTPDHDYHAAEKEYPLSIQGKVKKNKRLALIISFLILIDLLSAGVIVRNMSTPSQSLEKPTEVSVTQTPLVSPTLTTPPTVPSPTPPTQVTISQSPTPTLSNTPTTTPGSSDTEPPRTNIIQPSEGSTSNYRVNGQVCAALGAPTDNVTSASEIETRYKFDDGGWSSYERMVANACASLANGPHIFSVQSKDKAGNEEPVQTRNFTAVD